MGSPQQEVLFGNVYQGDFPSLMLKDKGHCLGIAFFFLLAQTRSSSCPEVLLRRHTSIRNGGRVGVK